MPVIAATSDLDAKTITLVATFDASVEAVWGIYTNGDQLAQVWGPPDYPATFDAHNLAVGERSMYHMTGPDGQKYYGIWDIETVIPKTRFEFVDAFADDHYNVNEALPKSLSSFIFEPTDDGMQLTFQSTYQSVEDVQRVLEMGAIEGTTAAMNQIDDHLAKG